MALSKFVMTLTISNLHDIFYYTNVPSAYIGHSQASNHLRWIDLGTNWTPPNLTSMRWFEMLNLKFIHILFLCSKIEKLMNWTKPPTQTPFITGLWHFAHLLISLSSFVRFSFSTRIPFDERWTFSIHLIRTCTSFQFRKNCTSICF